MVIGAVRDGARFASRHAFDEVGCIGGAPTLDLAAEQDIQRATRLHSLAGADSFPNRRIHYWSADDTVTVTVECPASPTGTNGIYADLDEIPRVRVEATVPYQSLFGVFGLIPGLSFDIVAQSEAVVVGG